MTGPANGRAHLSIGEVLSLLQDEFPDVTISKIRFLESQGLLDPERTPSGYRKFYHADIERLRWILHQQKEHYLPLKVIKERLDRAGGAIPNDGPDDGPEPGTRASRGPRDAASLSQQRLPPGADLNGSSGSHRGDGNRRDRSRRGRDSGPEGGEHSSRNGKVATLGSPEPAEEPPEVRPRTRPSPPPEEPREGPEETAAPAPSSSPAPAAPETPTGPPERWADSGWDRDDETSRRVSPTVLPAPPPPPEPPLSGRGTGPQGGPRRPQAREPEPASPPGPQPPPDADPPPEPDTLPAGMESGMSDVSLTLEELAEASGLSTRDIRDLEGFGLIERADVDGARIYDGDALIVARTAAGFFQHGIEARHMRTYKVAMEREAGLFEQIILPTLRQRNPEARRQAARTVTELMRLGEVMRSVLLRRELRDHLQGGS